MSPSFKREGVGGLKDFGDQQFLGMNWIFILMGQTNFFLRGGNCWLEFLSSSVD